VENVFSLIWEIVAGSINSLVFIEDCVLSIRSTLRTSYFSVVTLHCVYKGGMKGICCCLKQRILTLVILTLLLLLLISGYYKTGQHVRK